MSTILITGGAGFIGSHTANELVKLGHSVRVLDLLDPQIHGQDAKFPEHVNRNVEWLRGDVCNPEKLSAALDGVNVIYHFAAQTGVGQSMYNLSSYVQTNLTGLATLLEVLLKRDRPIKRFILASSRAVYGEGTHECSTCGTIYPLPRQRKDLEKGRFEINCSACRTQVKSVPTKEDRPLSPISVYGWTKKEQEELCQYVAQTYALPVVCLRYFNVYGSHQSLKNPYTGVVSIFYSRLTAGQPISLYEHGMAGRDFVHVSDVVHANILAMEAEIEPGTCINVGTGKEHTIVEVARALAKTCGLSAHFQDCGEFRMGDIRSCYADLDGARRLLGYEPRLGLEEGLQEFVNWAGGQDAIDLYQQTVDELQRFGLFGGNRTGAAQS